MHRLNSIRWEHWSEGGEVDVNEQGYDMDEWTGPLAIEARDVARRASASGERGVVSRVEDGQGDTSKRGAGLGREDTGSAMSKGSDAEDEEEGSEGMGEIGRVEVQSSKFDWARGRGFGEAKEPRRGRNWSTLWSRSGTNAMRLELSLGWRCENFTG